MSISLYQNLLQFNVESLSLAPFSLTLMTGGTYLTAQAVQALIESRDKIQSNSALLEQTLITGVICYINPISFASVMGGMYLLERVVSNEDIRKEVEKGLTLAASYQIPEEEGVDNTLVLQVLQFAKTINGFVSCLSFLKRKF